MQHATDWKNVAAEVIPIGVEDCSALYTYVSIVAVVLKIEPLAPWESWKNRPSDRQVVLEDFM